MVDISKHIAYWRDGAEEDWQVAYDLVAGGKVRHGLFFAHLALEKLLKSHVCRATGQMAPRIHNLNRLAQLSELSLDEERKKILAAMNEFNLEGRYPLNNSISISKVEADGYIKRAEEIYQWLIKQL